MDALLNVLVFAALFYFMMRFGCGAHMMRGHAGHARGSGRQQPATGPEATDPVCGMKVGPEQGYTTVHDGQSYRLCSRACLDRFEANPRQYVRTTTSDRRVA